MVDMLVLSKGIVLLTCFRAESEVVLSNLETLCTVALGEKVTEDFLLARDAVITISSITDHNKVNVPAALSFKGAFIEWNVEVSISAACVC